MNDFEIYMMKQNPGYHSVYLDEDRIEYNSGSGLMGNEAYMEYMERNYNNVYLIPGEFESIY